MRVDRHNVPLALGAALVALALSGCMATRPQAERIATPPVSPLVEAILAPPATASAPAGNALVDDNPWASFERVWALVEARQYEQAEQGFSVWLSVHGQGDHPRTPKALFWMGYSQEKLNRPKATLETYQRLQTRFPNSLEAARAARRREALLVPPAVTTAPATAPATMPASAPAESAQ